jgi:NTE family protein
LEKILDKAESGSGKRVSLVLGSGGARGLAHIGVIEELEARGYTIEAIAGCSIGALVGGIYAAGKLKEYAEWATQLERSGIIGLLDLTGARGGFIAGKKIMRKLREWVEDVVIEDLPLKYTAVAVDIEREKEVWMSEGSLCDAIRASIAIPGVFTPHRYRGRLLVDGGVLNPLPVAPTVNSLTDLTIVVDANGPPTNLVPLEPERNKVELDNEPSLFAKGLEQLGLGGGHKSTAKDVLDIAEVLMRTVDTVQAAMTRQQLAVFHPDLLIRVPRNLCMMHEFHRAEEIIALGRRVATELLDDPELERRQWL